MFQNELRVMGRHVWPVVNDVDDSCGCQQALVTTGSDKGLGGGNPLSSCNNYCIGGGGT
jgi:hypothetical protein